MRENLSLPYDRIIQTKQANPNLASQPPIVNSTNRIKISDWELWEIKRRTKVKITPSNAINDINKWRRWIIKVIIDAKVINLIEAEPRTYIAYGI